MCTAWGRIRIQNRISIKTASLIRINTMPIPNTLAFSHAKPTVCNARSVGFTAASQIPVCPRMLGSNPDPGLLRLWHWQSDGLTNQLGLIHNSARYQ